MSTSSSGKSLKIDESVEIDTDQESINDNVDPSELEAAEARCTESQCTEDSIQDKNISTADPKLSCSELKMTDLESKESQDKVVKSLAEIKSKDPRFLSKKKDVGIGKEDTMQPNSSGQKVDPKLMSQMMSMDPWCFSNNDVIDHEEQKKKEIDDLKRMDKRMERASKNLPKIKSQEDGLIIKESTKKEISPIKDNEPCKSQSSSSSANKQQSKINMKNPFGKVKNLKQVQTTTSNVPMQNTLARIQNEEAIDKSELPSSTSGTSIKGLDEKMSPDCQFKDTPKIVKDETIIQYEISEATSQQVGETHLIQKGLDIGERLYLKENPHEMKNITRTVTNDLAGFQKPHPVSKPENMNRFGLAQRISGMYGTGSFENLPSLKNSFQGNVDNPQVSAAEFRTPGAMPMPMGARTSSPLPFGSGSLAIGRNNERSFPMDFRNGMPALNPFSKGATTSGSYDINASTSLPHAMGAENSGLYPLGARPSGAFPIDANTSLPYSASNSMRPSGSGQFTARPDVSRMFAMGASRLGSMPTDSSISGMSELMNQRRFMGFPLSGSRERFMGAEGLVGPSPYEKYSANILNQRGMLGSLEGSIAGDLGSLEEIERKKQRNMMELKQLEEMKFRKLQEMKAFQMMEMKNRMENDMKNRMEKEMEMYLSNQMQPGGFDHMVNKPASINNNEIRDLQMPDVQAQIQLKENQIKFLQKFKQMEKEKIDSDINRKNGNEMSVKQRLGQKKARDPVRDDFPKINIESRKKRFGRNLSPFRDNEKSISKGGRKRRNSGGGSIPDDLVLTEFGENGPIKKIAKIGTSGEPQKKPSTKVSDDKDILADLDPNDPMAKCILDSFNEPSQPTIETNVSEISGVMGSVPKNNLDTEVKQPLLKSLGVNNEIKKDALDFDESDLHILQDEEVVNEAILDSDEEDMLDLVFDEQEQFELERLGKF